MDFESERLVHEFLEWRISPFQSRGLAAIFLRDQSMDFQGGGPIRFRGEDGLLFFFFFKRSVRGF